MASILVVDDHTDTNEMLCRLLRSYGHKTASAFTGEGALVMIGVERPELVVLDVMMPGMDGMEVLRLIRRDPATATVPVIFYSGVSDPEFRQHALRKGANDYWVKGALDLSHLNEMIARYVASSARTLPN